MCASRPTTRHPLSESIFQAVLSDTGSENERTPEQYAHAQIAAQLATPPHDCQPPAEALCMPVDTLLADCHAALIAHPRPAERLQQVQIRQRLGTAYAYADDAPQALTYLRQALDILTQLDIPDTRADVLLQIGHVHRQQKAWTDATDCYRRAIDIINDSANADTLMRYWSQKGMTHLAADETNAALLSLQRAWEYARATNCSTRQGYAARQLGDVYRARYDFRRARLYYEEASHYYDKPPLELQIAIGITHGELNDTDRAIHILEAAIQRSQDDANPTAEACICGHLGDLHYRLEAYDDAATHYKRAADMHRQTNDVHALERTLSYLGSAYSQVGRHDDAIICLHEAIELAQTLGDVYIEETTMARLAIAYQRQGKHAKAIWHYKNAVYVTERLREKGTQAHYTFMLGLACYDVGEYEQAEMYFTDAKERFQEIGSETMQRSVDEMLMQLSLHDNG